MEHQQDGIKGKWESLKCHGQLNWLHRKTLTGSNWKLKDQNVTVVNRM